MPVVTAIGPYSMTKGNLAAREYPYYSSNAMYYMAVMYLLPSSADHHFKLMHSIEINRLALLSYSTSARGTKVRPKDFNTMKMRMRLDCRSGKSIQHDGEIFFPE